MDKIAVVEDVALKLSEAEAAIDVAISKTCRLIDGLMTARAELRLSTTVGGECGDRLAASLASLMEARKQTAAAHGELSGVQTRRGLRRMNLSMDPTGPLDKPPPPSGRHALDEPSEESAEVRTLRRA